MGFTSLSGILSSSDREELEYRGNTKDRFSTYGDGTGKKDHRDDRRYETEVLVDRGGLRHTVSYCQYGDTRMKPTDIWTNCKEWHPKPICKPRSSCHESAPRGARTGTQGIKGAKDRGSIPKELFYEIFKVL
jgi:hypothetical protein